MKKTASYRVLMALGSPLRAFPPFRKRPRKWDQIVAVDSGGDILYEAGLPADVLVGDFDSIGSDAFEFHRGHGARIHRFATDKDFTDFEGALKLLDCPGNSEINIIGMIGGRIDHFLTNIMVLRRYVKKGLFTFDTGEGFGGVMGKGEVRLGIREGCPTALIALSPEVRGIRSEGVKWPLADGKLRFGTGRGISNLAVAATWRLSVESGALLWLVTGLSRAASEIEWRP